MLAKTVLGTGTGTSTRCTFTFSFTVMDGEDDYVLTISHRGDLHYSAAELMIPGAISLTLGS